MSASHPAFASGRTAVITGAASGIGLAAAKLFADYGMNVVLADLPSAALDAAVEAVGRIGSGRALAAPTDVSSQPDVLALKSLTFETFGDVAVLMNNAGAAPGGGPYDHYEGWERVLGINLWGVINGVQAFTPEMITQGRPGLIINTGSKQGITAPPGDTAYNVSKAGVKVLTEGLAHQLRNQENCRLSAHLLIPGFVWSGMTARGRPTKPDGAWTPEQTIAFMVERIQAGDFYILCPDNETTPAMDRKRVAWAAGDLIDNRPALSRWHPDYKTAFDAHMAGD